MAALRVCGGRLTSAAVCLAVVYLAVCPACISGDLVDVALWKPVSVDPPTETCGSDGQPRNFEYHYRSITCKTSCPRPYEGPETPRYVEADLYLRLGYSDCGAPTTIYSSSGPRQFTEAPQYRRKRRDDLLDREKRQDALEYQNACYFEDKSPSPIYDYETYVMRLKPDPALHRTVLFDRGLYEVYLLYNISSKGFDLELKGRTIQGRSNVVHVGISPGVWSHLTITMKKVSYWDPILVNVFLNGSHKGEGDVSVPLNIPSRKKKQAGQQVNIQPLNIGWSESLNRNFEKQCVRNVMETCLEAGYDYYINGTNDAYAIETSVLELVNSCEGLDDKKMLKLFGCAALITPCDQEFPRPICREFCQDIIAQCPTDTGNIIQRLLNASCSDLPSKNSSQCISDNYMPELSIYRGEMKRFRIFNTILTERQIQEDYTGTFPKDGFYAADCLCNSTYPYIPTGPGGVPADHELLCTQQYNQTFEGYYEGRYQRAKDSPVYKPLNTMLRIGELTEGYSRPEYATLGYPEVGWLSAGSSDEVSLDVDFQGRAQVFYVEFLVGNYYPNEIVLQKYSSNGGWEPLAAKVFESCHQYTVPAIPCESFGLKGDGNQRLNTPEKIIFNILDGRSGWTVGGGLNETEPSDYDYYANEDGDYQEGYTPNYLPTYVREPTTLEPDLANFLLTTRIRITFKRLSSLSFPIISVSSLHAYGWPKITCNCHSDGTLPGETCDEKTGKCPCRPKAQGKISPSNIICSPYVESILANYGPVSGGTAVFLWGGFFGSGNNTDKVTVQMADTDIYFKVLKYNETIIQCVTPPLNQSEQLDIVGQAKPLIITLASGTQIFTNQSDKTRYTYRPDPTIRTVTPLHSFLRGGILQTVIGQHLDSVLVPKMTVTLVYLKQLFNYGPTLCEVLNATLMTCPSPVIELPAGIAGPGGRKRRDVLNSHQGERIAIEEHREKRQSGGIEAGKINKDYRQFYIGFILDGVLTYRNVSEAVPGMGIISVYTNPELYEFNPKTMPFKPFKGDKVLSIKGKYLSYGCELEDYVVKIGEDVCENIEPLFDNELSCSPPETEPHDRFELDGAPRVVVSVGNILVTLGYIQYYNSDWEVASVRNAVIAVVVIAVLILVVVLLCIWYHRLREKYPLPAPIARFFGLQPPRARDNLYVDGMELGANRPLLERLPSDLKAILEDCLIPASRLHIDRQIGSGHFGTVHVGTLAAPHDLSQLDIVAIKTVKDGVDSTKDLTEFLQEGTIMKDFDHKNVLSLIGVVIKDNRPFVLLPYMDKGDLRKYVSDNNMQFTCRQLMEMTHQVAKGMAYLANRNFVHRDLAARNCMVNSDELVTIADFGLARDIYEKDYYRTADEARPLPIKWMALESLMASKFDTKSDVWSFGVLMWETICRGLKPYLDLGAVNWKEMRDYLNAGHRLEKPEFCPDDFYDIMLKCWREKPAQRPTFSQLEKQIEALLNHTRASVQGGAAPQTDYDDATTLSAEDRDYLVIVPHPHDQFDDGTGTPRSQTPNSEMGLLEDNQNPLELEFSKVKVHEVPAKLSDVDIEMSMPLGQAAAVEGNNNAGYLRPVNQKPEERAVGGNENDGYLRPVNKNPEQTGPQIPDGKLPPASNEKATPETVRKDENLTPGNSRKAQDAIKPDASSIVPISAKDSLINRMNTPQEGYMPMDKNSPKPSPRPKPRIQGDAKGDYLTPGLTPQPKPRSASPKPSPKSSPKPKPKERSIDKPIPVAKPKPKPKPKNSGLDSVVPPREALEGYMPMNKQQQQQQQGKRPEAPTEEYTAMKQDDPDYLAPVQSNKNSPRSSSGDYLSPVSSAAMPASNGDHDDYLVPNNRPTGGGDDGEYLAPVSQGKDESDDYTRPIAFTNTSATSANDDPDYDNRKSFV